MKTFTTISQRGSRLIAAVGVLCAVALTASSPVYPVVGGSSRATVAGAGASCSAATATQLVNQHHLNNFLLPKPVNQVLCGPFAGPGSQAMAVTIEASTCWGVQSWAVFNFSGGAWQLVFQRAEFIFPPLVVVGSDIRVTTPVFRAGDPRCVPSGGKQAQTWHWNGSTFVGGVPKQVGAPTGASPTPSGGAGWKSVAARAAYPVFEPKTTLGLKLVSVALYPCGIAGGKPFTSARYSKGGGSTAAVVGFTETYPTACGNAGEANPVTEVDINGVKVSVLVYLGGSCSSGDCKVANGFANGFFLFVRPLGAQGPLIQVDSRYISLPDLLKVVRSLARVPK